MPTVYRRYVTFLFLGTSLFCMKPIVSVPSISPKTRDGCPNSISPDPVHIAAISGLGCLMSCLYSIIFLVSSSYTAIARCDGSADGLAVGRCDFGVGILMLRWSIMLRCSMGAVWLVTCRLRVRCWD